jgi:TolB-like protein/Tfp pilus assembly protein PilF
MRIDLRLLGRFGATVDSRPPRIVQMSAPRRRAVLAYLALQPTHMETRERLAALLWGNATDHQARQSLRQCLVALRKEFQAAGRDPLVIERDVIGLDPSRVVVDAREFMALAASDDAGDLDRAMDLYKGELLDGLELDIEPFNDWVRGERARIAAAAAGAFERSAAEHDAAGDGPGALRAAERLVALDPLREAAHRLLLRMLAKYKGRDAALAHAEGLAQRVRDELDSDLEPETAALIADLRASAPVVAAGRRPDPPLPATPSIVVLPFANLSDDPAQAYFADGVTEDITTALSRLRWLFVIARNSAYVFKDKPADVRSIARELGVRYMLEGSVRAVGQRIRITGQLIDAEKGKHIWAQKYDREVHDIFAVQDEITEHIVAAIEPHLYAEEGYRAAGQPPENVDVWGLVVRAIGLINKFGRKHNEEAQRLLRRAIEIDPHYARAHAILSWAIWWATLYYYFSDRYEGYRQSARHAEQAMLLDQNEPWARMVIGLNLSTAGLHERALAEHQTALNLNPSFALGRMTYGWALLRAGRFDEAIAETAKAIRMSPMDSFLGLYTAIHGLALLAAGRFADALPHLRESVSAGAEFAGHYNTLISCCGHLGLVDEAREYIARRNRIGPPLRVRVLRNNLRGFAHCDVFTEGLTKAGVPE